LKRFFKNNGERDYFGIFDYMKTVFSSRRKLLNASIDKIYEKIDITHLIKKIMEIDKLKMLLLTSD
jgi:16S rRNA A1518/A1519 N6-dimethyltransferase RsmA/KsgA/DIM1 with predicted DNA glycosylase/AP lyase activity